MGEPIDGQGPLPSGPAPYTFRGIFSGSGVGKSVLLSMLARNVAADVSVIGLVGERGREVQEFLQDDLGPAGLARSVKPAFQHHPLNRKLTILPHSRCTERPGRPAHGRYWPGRAPLRGFGGVLSR